MQKKLMLTSLILGLAATTACSKRGADVPAPAATTSIDMKSYMDLKPVDLQRDPVFGPKFTAIIPKSTADCVRGTLEQLRPLAMGSKGEVYAQGFGSHADNWTEGYVEISQDGQLDVGVVCSDFATAADRHIHYFTTRGTNVPLHDGAKLWINELTSGEGTLTIFDGKQQKDTAVAEMVSSVRTEVAGELSIPAVTETTISGESFQSVGGMLAVAEIDYVRKLTWNGTALGDIEDDHINLEKVYRYGDRDVVLVTHACGGSACTFTALALVEIPKTGQPKVLTNDELTINSDGTLPDIAVEPDGSLLIQFTGFKGKEKWRYSNGTLNKA